MCRTFFRKGDKDYTQGQPRYTLLKKEKKDVQTGEIIVQYYIEIKRGQVPLFLC